VSLFTARRFLRPCAPAPLIALALLLGSAPQSRGAGPYDPASGPGSLGVAAASPLFVGWATGAPAFVRGPQNIAIPDGPLATFGTPANALGAANGSLVSLGDGGSITLTFAAPITNGAGADFAVFENGFLFNGGVYAELGFVEVSSNGTDFFRFDAVSLTPTATQVGPFDALDPTNVSNLAGKHVAGLGTPFDLAELAGRSPLLNVAAVTHVRVIDVVGSIDPRFGRRDSLGNLINDPYATAFGSGGFDLDAVGVLNAGTVATPAPPTALALLVGAAGLAGWRRNGRRAA